MALPELPKTRDPERCADWLKASATTLPFSQEEADTVATAIERARTPAAPDEIGAQVMVIVAQYFVGDQPRFVRDATVAIWMEHLRPFPLWAIKRAVSWWIGPENDAKARSRRPQPGDIAEVCQRMMAPIERAEQSVAWWAKYRGAYPRFITTTTERKTA